MRKLLVKLVAAETAVLGWLTYWLFLVYADNPTISEGLASQLTRFPQVSYTTIDISIIVIIAIFSILLAIKFDRGLRPGMKLERALQMLENLMKRNLFLESQLAELRGDKLPSNASGIQSRNLAPPSNSLAGGEMLEGSTWERAFRTPIEAGPSNVKLPMPAPSPLSRPPSIDPTAREYRGQTVEPTPTPQPPPLREEKIVPKVTTISTWEDNPSTTMETRGIITPSQPSPKKLSLETTPPPSTLVQSTRLPYIPAPAPKTPPGVIITGPINRSSPIASYPKPGTPAQAKPATKPASPQQQPTISAVRPSGTLQPLTTLTPFSTTKPPAKPSIEQPQTILQKSTPAMAPSSTDDGTREQEKTDLEDDGEESDDISSKADENPKKTKGSSVEDDSD